jgi:hypothetical protein
MDSLVDEEYLPVMGAKALAPTMNVARAQTDNFTILVLILKKYVW